VEARACDYREADGDRGGGAGERPNGEGELGRGVGWGGAGKEGGDIGWRQATPTSCCRSYNIMTSAMGSLARMPRITSSNAGWMAMMNRGTRYRCREPNRLSRDKICWGGDWERGVVLEWVTWGGGGAANKEGLKGVPTPPKSINPSINQSINR
jgi:hypothetical protein